MRTITNFISTVWDIMWELILMLLGVVVGIFAVIYAFIATICISCYTREAPSEVMGTIGEGLIEVAKKITKKED